MCEKIKCPECGYKFSKELYKCDVCRNRVVKKDIFTSFSKYAREYFDDDTIEQICRDCVYKMDRNNFFEKFEEAS